MQRRAFLQSAGLGALSVHWTLSTGCSSTTSTGSEKVWADTPGPKILTVFAPLHTMALAILGDVGQVQCLSTTQGVHFHGDPTRREIDLARNCDLMVALGLGLDDKIVRNLRATAKNPNWSSAMLGDSIPKAELKEGECRHKHAPGEKHDHPTDVHVWLSPKRMIPMARALAKEIVSLAPTAKAKIEANTEQFVQKLEGLHQHILKSFQEKKERAFITFHDSMQYFAADAGLSIPGVIQIDPGTEPNASEMKQLVEFCVKNQIRVIAVEPQFSDKNAAAAIRQALQQKGIQAAFTEFDTLETADPKKLGNNYYFDVMQENINSLAKALN